MTNEQTEMTAYSVSVEQIREACSEACSKACVKACKEEESREELCPYFLRDRGKGVIYCECARFHFPDKLARREYVYAFCAHPSGYKQCPIKRAMDHFYDRKYSKPDEVTDYAVGKQV